MFKRGLVLTIIILSICGFFTPVISSEMDIRNIDYNITYTIPTSATQEIFYFTFYTFDKTGKKQNTVELCSDSAIEIKNVFEDFQYKIICEPNSIKTQEFKNNFINSIDKYGLLSEKQSKDQEFSILNPGWLRLVYNNLKYVKPFFSSNFNGTSYFCSVSSYGYGKVFPIIMLPRPRGVAFWIASNANTSIANVFNGKGFFANGLQGGLLIGFIGVGFSLSGPDFTIYSFIGYSLFAGVNAEIIEFYPPNNKSNVSGKSSDYGIFDVLRNKVGY